MTTPLESRNALLAKTVVSNLEKRHFEAYYCPTAQEALKKVLDLIPEGSSIGWGGSMSIRDMGLTKAIHEGNYTVIDRDLAKSPEETYEMQQKCLLTDYFITSANAIAEEGILVNIDGTGNRVAAICFGPKNVIVVCGINKIAQNLDAAISRTRFIAAPINAGRFDIQTPCKTTGKCHNCISPDCICSEVLITRTSRPAKRIKIILVGEELGY
ncbi:MAG TPA: lactate utilization protein [Candidatus Coprocola pullicola]|nr:lactate utilization protein [Candidatus Coprocola pullicola]